jgi:type VI protein secretion system component VasF
MTTESPLDSVPDAEQPHLRHGKWKRKKRALWKRIFFRKSTLVALAAIVVALALVYYLLHHIDNFKASD